MYSDIIQAVYELNAKSTVQYDSKSYMFAWAT